MTVRVFYIFFPTAKVLTAIKLEGGGCQGLNGSVIKKKPFLCGFPKVLVNYQIPNRVFIFFHFDSSTHLSHSHKEITLHLFIIGYSELTSTVCGNAGRFLS